VNGRVPALLIALFAIIVCASCARERQDIAKDWILEARDSFAIGELTLDEDGTFDILLAITVYVPVESSARGKWRLGDGRLILTTERGEEIAFDAIGKSHVELLRYRKPSLVPVDRELFATFVADLAFTRMDFVEKKVVSPEPSITSNIMGGFAVFQPNLGPESVNYSKAYLIQRPGCRLEKSRLFGSEIRTRRSR